MEPKEWVAMEIQELADKAQKRGYNKKALAAWIGVDPATLSRWMQKGRGELPLLTRNALSWVDFEITKKPEIAPPPARKKKEGDA